MDIADAIRKSGYEVEEYPEMLKMASYLSDEEVDGLMAYVREHNIQVIVTLYFAMNAALAAYKSEIRYVSVLWDAPYVENYNPLSKIDNVWITTFDKLDRDRFLAYGTTSGLKRTGYRMCCTSRCRSTGIKSCSGTLRFRRR